MLFFVIIRLWLAATLPLTPDEAYYWVWSRHLQGGYFDHPFMVALWVKLGTFLMGDTPLGVRLLGPVSCLLGSWSLVYAARELIPSRSWPQSGYKVVLLLNATLMIGIGSATMTPDTPLVFFISVFLFSLGKALASKTKKSMIWWGLTGVFLGLAFDSKYTAVLIVIALGLYGLCKKELRKNVGFWVVAPVFSIMIMPVVYWNYTHHWASFMKQGGRTGAWQPERALQFLSELIGGQIGLATPIIFIFFVLGIGGARKKNRLLSVLIILPMIVFLAHALGDRVQANWLALLYPICALVAVEAVRSVRWGVISGVGITLLIYGQTLFAFIPFPPAKDPIQRQTAGWPLFTQQLILKAKQQGASSFVVDEYGLASQLAFNQNVIPVVGTDRRWSLFDMQKQHYVQGLLVKELHHQAANGENGSLCRESHNKTVRCYQVEVVSDPTGMLLPTHL
ncbi:ArnT family glycosyltransferase [Swingsia samuiensis]|uniref:ArnT family glycosyltransferase n=1 Tax=Swingsia samuiensis TaxID=1293412 RepID=UPI001FEB2A62|nr:glycosyltransferase family 39 protein [Swingsia samuiensis]